MYVTRSNVQKKCATPGVAGLCDDLKLYFLSQHSYLGRGRGHSDEKKQLYILSKIFFFALHQEEKDIENMQICRTCSPKGSEHKKVDTFNDHMDVIRNV